MLKDNKPGETEDILEPGKAATAMAVEEEEDAPMPEPFEYLG